jgi:multidrug efflux system membrane fusion protein
MAEVAGVAPEKTSLTAFAFRRLHDGKADLLQLNQHQATATASISRASCVASGSWKEGALGPKSNVLSSIGWYVSLCAQLLSAPQLPSRERERHLDGEGTDMIRRHSLSGSGGLLLALTTVLGGCGPGAPPVAETPPPPVSVSHPVARTIRDSDDYNGQIAAVKTVQVRARVRGHLIKVHFQDGTIVKEKELLYEIDPRPAKASVDAAKAMEAAAQASQGFAKAEYMRTRELVARGAATREELESWIAKEAVARGDVLKAQAAVEQAELDLDFTKIRAPMTGKVSRTQVDEGNLVNAGGGEQLLTTLVTTDPFFVNFTVDERSLLRYRKAYRKEVKDDSPQPPIKDLHIPVRVALDGEKDYPHTGEIDFADNRVNPSTGTILVRGVLSNKRRIFDDGMRAQVRIELGEEYTAVMVSESAVGNDQGKKFIYVVNADKVAQRRDVELGRVRDGLQVIAQGLKPQEWVIVNGIQRVRDGMKVEPQEVPMPGDRPAAQSAREKPTTK